MSVVVCREGKQNRDLRLPGAYLSENVERRGSRLAVSEGSNLFPLQLFGIMKLFKVDSLLIWILICATAYGQPNDPPISVFGNRVSPEILRRMIEVECAFGMDVNATVELTREAREAFLADPSLNTSPSRKIVLEILDMFDDMALHAETGRTLVDTPIKLLYLKADPHLSLLVACAQARVAQWNGQNKLASELFKLVEDLVPHTNNDLLKTIAYSRIVQHRMFFLDPKEMERTLPSDIALLREYQNAASCTDGQLALELYEIRAKHKNNSTKFAAEVKKLFLIARDNGLLEQASELLRAICIVRRQQGDLERVERIIEAQRSLAEDLNNPLLEMRQQVGLISHFGQIEDDENAMEAAKYAYDMGIFSSLSPYLQSGVVEAIKTAALRTDDERYLIRMRKIELSSEAQSACDKQFRESERHAISIVKYQRVLLEEHIEGAKRQQLILARMQEHEKTIAQQKQDVQKLSEQVKQKTAEIASLDIALADRDSEIASKTAESQVLTDKIASQRVAVERLGNLVNAALNRANLWMWFVLILATIILGALIYFYYRKHLNASGELKIQERNVDELSLKLARMRRMDSLGLMAGSIAHDFNNILVGITGNADLIDLAQSTGEFGEDYVMERVAAIKVSAMRAKKLSMQMLKYAGKQYIAQETRDLNKIVIGYQAVLTSFSKKNHQVIIELGQTPLISKVDDTQVEQAILNIVTNAINASPDGGQITVRTFVTQIGNVGSDNTLFGSRQAGGAFCCIEIEDSGLGIPAHQIEQIFEPYFSKSGPGRGLGLAIVYGIIDSHQGLIRCESTYGQGTKFQLLLPVCDADQEIALETRSPEDSPKIQEHHRGKRVLVIDDEIGVIDTCEQLMLKFGLNPKTIHIQGEGGIGLVLDALAEETFDCIMLDVVMPELTGTQILDALEEREISTPVILMSGFSPERLDFYHKRSSVEAILPKPFGISELIHAIDLAMPVVKETSLHDGAESVR